jgi:3-methyladenine DNA glycosylase AlkD
LWVRRAAAVSLTPLARRGENLDTAYSVATALLDSREDLMHKAVGWLLRECGKTDERKLEAFLLQKGPGVPRTALRYAIERFPPARRRRILEETRSD